jgi:dephospho-CoA kinase
MLIVGLTGSFKTGKSSVALMFKELGARIIDSDKIVHDLLKKNQTCINEIRKVFGEDVVVKREVNRKVLAGIVFSNPLKLKKLEEIIHPRVRREVLKQLKAFKSNKRVKVVIVDIPLLFESGLEKLVDLTVVVKSTQEQQIKRAQKQLKITVSEAKLRIKAQMPLKNKILLADFIIDNKDRKSLTRKQVGKLWGKWLVKRKRHLQKV